MTIPPRLGGGIISSWWGRKSSGQEGKGKGKGKGKEMGKGKGNRKGKREGKRENGREEKRENGRRGKGKGREGWIFFPGERGRVRLGFLP